MKRHIFNVFIISVALITITIRPVHATQTYTEAPGSSWFSLDSNTAGVKYMIKNSSDNSNLEFASNDNGTIRGQLFNINKLGNVGIGVPLSAGAKFQVTTSSNMWAGRFVNTGADIRFGLQGGHGIFMQSGATTTGYQMRVFKGSDLKFEIQHDGKTFINNTLTAKQIVVKSNVWADYVFDKDYKLPGLDYVEEFINKNGHLPGIESAKEVTENGISVSDMQAKQMAKIEELTLYTIHQQKEIDELREQSLQLEKRLAVIEKSMGV